MEKTPQSILVSLASSTNIISYDTIMNALNIRNERQLEEFIIESIYQGVIKVNFIKSISNFQGTLNPQQRRIEIIDWDSQQMGEVDLNYMQDILEKWIQNCSSFINTLHSELGK